ncbi:hypothetical protein V490_04716 [Pseudogymnoascus sp. VKM F-3557]|nr:hypothetical protein V490_04716 [Pseudogymnoascus sp. VKM F-3557]
MLSVQFSCLAILILANFAFAGSSKAKWLSPIYDFVFQFPLPIPPEIQPFTSYTDPETGTAIDFYQLNITKFETQIYPNLGKTQLVGYNGISPGPTFRIIRGRETVIRVENQQDRPSVVHLHGSYTRPVWDGWAEDLIQPGQFKDYYFPNTNTARTMWYHDHAVMITATNVMSGLSGFYIVEDPSEEARLSFPQGKYDIPLGLSAKQYGGDGSLVSVVNELDSLYGDVIEVNGQPWPYLAVEPRKYRFRLLDMSLSRTFTLSIHSSTNGQDKAISFLVVASDSGFMATSVVTNTLTMAMAERWEIIVDFAPFIGQNLTMKNEREVFADTDYAFTDHVMQFNVGNVVSSNDNNGPAPSSLTSLDLPSAKSSVDRTFKFDQSHDAWLINGVSFEDVQNRVLADPPRGKTEVWSLENHSGSWSHPIHIHLVDFQITSRSKGRKSLQPYEVPALKDVVVLGPNERVQVLVRFSPYPGLYMFHCHNLIHEDHSMMAAFNVTQLQELGYTETDLLLIDPLESRWRAKDVSDSNLADLQSVILPAFAATRAYQNVTTVTAELGEYWANHTSHCNSLEPLSLSKMLYLSAVTLLVSALCII